jgi:tetratricopeptide (TPR) repeat protein
VIRQLRRLFARSEAYEDPLHENPHGEQIRERFRDAATAIGAKKALAKLEAAVAGGTVEQFRGRLAEIETTARTRPDARLELATVLEYSCFTDPVSPAEVLRRASEAADLRSDALGAGHPLTLFIGSLEALAHSTQENRLGEIIRRLEPYIALIDGKESDLINAQGVSLLGSALRMTGDLERARACQAWTLEQARRSNPKTLPACLWNLANIELELKHKTEALDLFRETVEVAESQDEELELSMLYQLTKTLYLLEDDEAAARAFQLLQKQGRARGSLRVRWQRTTHDDVRPPERLATRSG